MLPRVLIVDGNEDFRDALVEMLRLWGYEATSVSSADEGLRMAREFRPDVVFLDLDLPDLSGHELARRLQAAHAAGPFVVGLTGDGRVDRAGATAAGCDVFFLKPIDPDVLQIVLEDNDATRWRCRRRA